MKVRVFTLKWSDEALAFDDEPLARFLEGRTALDVSEHFLVHDRTPVLILVVRYREEATDARESRVPPGPGRRRDRPDPTTGLTPEETARYEAVREWRNGVAKRTGRTPYNYFNNAQCVELIRKLPSTKAALAAVTGMGDAFMAEVGDELLKLVRALAAGSAGAPAAPRADGARATRPSAPSPEPLAPGSPGGAPASPTDSAGASRPDAPASREP